MTPDDFKKLCANNRYVPAGTDADGTVSFRKAPIPDHRDPGTLPLVERNPSDGALGQRQIQAIPPGRVLVRVTSFRTRLLDEDNLCEKYYIDLCRYAGIIRQDHPGAATIEVRQKKIGPKEPEFVRIEIFEA